MSSCSNRCRPVAPARLVPAAVAGVAMAALAACADLPHADMHANGGNTGVVPSALPIRPAPEPLQTVEKAMSTDCLKMGTVDVTQVNPEYPAEAARFRQEGWVRFTFDVEDGAIVRPQVTESSPAGLFDAAVLAWAVKLRYPVAGNASGCWMEYEYKLEPRQPVAK